MTCKTCNQKPVWKFTNQTQLCKNCFTDYFERKIFRTIRKYNLLPKDKTFKLKISQDLNTKVLKAVIEKKFKTKTGKPNISTNNLSQTAEKIFQNIIKGSFKFQKLKSPLAEVSDKEIEIYAKIKNIKGIKRKPNKKIQSLFQRFLNKNPDLERNILKASSQL